MEIIEFIKSTLIDSKNRIISNITRDDAKWFIDRNYIDEMNIILEKTSFLDINSPFSLRIFCVLEDIKQYPKCIVCNNIIKDFKTKKNIKYTCSRECNYKSSLRIKNSLKKNIETHGHFFNNNKKSKLTKKEKYGDENFNNYKKQQETMMMRYGVTSSLKLEHVRNNKKDSDKRKTIKKLIDKFSTEYECIDYKNFIFECRKCKSIINYDKTKYHTNVIRCYNCNPHNTSLGENELQNWLSSISTIKTNKKILSDNMEIDILIENHNLAIEYNGIYWHSDSVRPDKNYLLNKTNECNKLGYELLHIFENEWLDQTKQNIWKSIIKSKLNLNQTIGARKTILKNIDSKTCNNFLKENHLQGECNSSIRLGLFYNDELVSLLTMSKSRFNKNYDWEITRFCNKVNINVIGGFSKLLKHFKNEYNGSIITYADKRYSNGDLYKQNNFTQLKDSEPNYWYWKNISKLYSRIEFQKHKLKDKLDVYDENLSEFENMKINGWKRIWDCGNKVFTL